VSRTPVRAHAQTDAPLVESDLQRGAMRLSASLRALVATCAGFVTVPGQPGVQLKLLSPRRHLDPFHRMQIGGQLDGGILQLGRDLLQLHATTMRSPSHRGYLYPLPALWGCGAGQAFTSCTA